MYHLSCAHRWFQHRATGAPPHAPCPKCKAPYDMGQTVTIYLDVPRRAAADTPTPPARVKTRGGGARAPAASPSDPDGTIVIDSPDGAGASGLGAPDDPDDPSALAGLLPSEVASRCVALGERVAALREETRSLAAEANDARRRAREAEDAAAAAELATEDADALREELARTKHDLQMAIHQRDAAAFSERTCKAKTLRAQEELSERQNELQRLRGKVQALETQRKLERDLAEGRVAGEDDLIRRFRGEVAADPRRAVETLCRSLAGKNRQLHQQVEEYNKLARRLREKERALAAAEARFEAEAGSKRGGDSTRERERERERETSASGGTANAGAGLPGSLGGRVARGWGRDDDDDAWDPEGASSLFPRAKTKTTMKATKRARRDDAATNLTNLTNLSVSATRRDAFAIERFASTSTGGPLSRAAPARGSGSGAGSGPLRSGSSANVAASGRTGGAADQGEDLLDDILEGIDAAPLGKAVPGANAKTNAIAMAIGNAAASASAARPSSLRVPAGAASFARRGVGGGVGEDARASSNPAGDERDGKFVIHGADGRGGRAKVVRPGGSRAVAVAECAVPIDRFLERRAAG